MATIQCIEIDASKGLGSEILNCSMSLRQQVSRLAEIQAQMQNMFDTATSNYTKIESHFGLAAGQGSVLWGIVNGANTQIQGDAAVAKFTQWLINSN